MSRCAQCPLCYPGPVSRVDAIAVAGLDLWFNSNDHKPPHFHAERPSEWEVRVYFLEPRSKMAQVKWSRRKDRPSKTDLKKLLERAEAAREDLLDEWERKVNKGPAEK